jgi:eukaryotic-like serine/threonine-protein kinase
MMHGQPHAASPGMTPDYLPAGTEVNGFRLVRHVDSGGYGSVWLAESIHGPVRRYALKFSRHAPGAPRAADERAEREVRLLLQVAHPNVVRVLAHGRYPDPQTGLRYLVMDWVEGATLLMWTRRHNPPLRDLVRLSQKLAQAIQAMHGAGVVHRDLKPDNVLVREVDGEPFVGDLGAGDAAGGLTLTQPGLPPGTPAFRSPEAWAFARRARGAPYVFQPADDWYALGVTLYVLLAEVLPFPELLAGKGLAQWVASRQPVPPHLLNPRVPRALSRVVMRLLAKQPHRRYRDGNALCVALERALACEADWGAPVYPPRTPGAPVAPAKAAPMAAGSAEGVEENPQAQLQRLLLAEGATEEQRREVVALRRNRLLPAQPRAWPVSWMQVGVVCALAAVVAAAWLAWLSVLPAPTLSRPVALPPVGVSPPEREEPGTSPALCPPPPLAPSEQPPATEPLTPPPSVASADAHSHKEDASVKTDPSSEPVASTAPKRTASSSRAARASMCALGAAATLACPAVPTGPGLPECTPAHIDSMDELNDFIGVGGGLEIRLDANAFPYEPARPVEGDPITLRVGPIISRVIDERAPDFMPKGTRLYGYVLPSPGKADGFTEIKIRYTEMQVPGQKRRLLCAEATGAYKVGGTAERPVADDQLSFFKLVLQFSE